MVRLTSKERRNIPEEHFGLPDVKKYPLTDETHVRKAVQFFKYCPPAKRTVLAKNINSRAKELGLTMKVSPESTFFRFADKSILREGVDENTILATGRLDTLLTELGDALDMFTQSVIGRNKQFSALYDYMKFEGEQFHIIKSIDDYRQVCTLNRRLDESFLAALDFLTYHNKSFHALKQVNLFTVALVGDIVKYLETSVYKGDVIHLQKALDIFDTLITKYNINRWMILRYLHQTILFVKEKEKKLGVSVGDSMRRTISNFLEDRVKSWEKLYDSKYEESAASFYVIKDIDSHTMESLNMQLQSVTKHLGSIRNELKFQLDIILVSCGLDIPTNRRDQSVNGDGLCSQVVDIIGQLEGKLRADNIKLYDDCLSVHLSSKDVWALNELNVCETMFQSLDRYGNTVHYGKRGEQIFLITKTNRKVGEYILIELYDGMTCKINLFNLTAIPEAFDKSDKLCVKVISINQQSDTSKVSTLTEGISFDPNGDMKFEFRPKKLYMDQYAANHKLLVENHRLKNVEGMKTNLAVLFTMISDIERKYFYAPKDKINVTKKYDDAVKARTFAINDFKRYLRELLRMEPSFNFTEYYEQSDFGKISVNVKKDDILGIRKLFQTIILGR